jgi:hypothetical protein
VRVGTDLAVPPHPAIQPAAATTSPAVHAILNTGSRSAEGTAYPAADLSSASA